MEAPNELKSMTGIVPTSQNSPISYNCNKCSADYHFLGNLVNYMKQPHEGKKHICRHCGKFFYKRFQLDSHIKSPNTLFTAQNSNHKSTWVLDIMKDSGHTICPITNAKLLEDMEADVVFFQKHPNLTATLEAEFDEVPYDVQRLGFPQSMHNRIDETRQQDQIAREQAISNVDNQDGTTS